MLCDASISLAARVVYGYLALWAIKTDKASTGQRKIASDLGISRTTVNVAIRELEIAGHIATVSEGKGRGVYRLLSPLFRRSVMGESAGQVIEYYESDGVPHRREVVSRPKSSR